MSLKRNILANAFGQGWVAVMTVAFVPLYIRVLGIEAYGLIAVFTLLQTWMSLLDLGLGQGLNREMARFTAGSHLTQGIRDLLRSVEVLCAGMAVAGALLLVLLAPWLVDRWLRAGSLPSDQVVLALRLMALTIACKLMEGLYQGVLLGLQRQVALSAALALLATFRWGGAALVLVALPAGIVGFFWWQVLASLTSLAVLAALAYQYLPAGHRGRFSVPALRQVAPFAGGVLSATLLSLLLTQLDKVLLSRAVSLEAFGHYALAAFLAGAIQQLMVPIAQAYYPRLTLLASTRDQRELALIYHQAAQMVNLFIVPGALLLMLFAQPLLLLWTANPAVADAVAPLLVPLAAGSLLNGFMSVPYSLQLAHGWSSLAARVNTVAVLMFVPGLIWVIPSYGAQGAAWLWVALNAGYVLITIPIMHHRLLTEEKWRWYARDLLAPLIAAGTVLWILSLWRPETATRWTLFGWLLLVGVSASCAAAAAMPDLLRALLRSLPGQGRKTTP